MDDLKDRTYDFKGGFGGQSLRIDDDGRVAYAYLIAPDGKISADVWLYNRCASPIEPEWTDRAKLPFANPVDYVDEGSKFSLPTAIDQISVNWLVREGRIFAQVFARGVLFAELTEGDKPGRSRLAKKNGPLAKKLEPV